LPGWALRGSRKRAKDLLMSFDQLLLAGEFQALEFKTSFDKATIESIVAILSSIDVIMCA
jgi:hypothetical protein